LLKSAPDSGTATDPARAYSVLLGKWLMPGRSSVEGRPCCKQRLLYEVAISGLKAIEADILHVRDAKVTGGPNSFRSCDVSEAEFCAYFAPLTSARRNGAR
jgi:hypothetical protein